MMALLYKVNYIVSTYNLSRKSSKIKQNFKNYKNLPRSGLVQQVAVPDQLSAALFLNFWLLIMFRAFTKICAGVSLAGKPKCYV